MYCSNLVKRGSFIGVPVSSVQVYTKVASRHAYFSLKVHMHILTSIFAVELNTSTFVVFWPTCMIINITHLPIEVCTRQMYPLSE